MMEYSHSLMRCVAAVAVLLAVGACASCSSSSSSGEPRFSGVYAKEYEQVYAQAKKEHNKFVLDALSDGKLTEAETQEAADRYVQCMADKGYSTTKFTDGTGDIYHPDQSDDDQWSQKMNKDDGSCNRSSGIDMLSGLWEQMRTNPDKKNSDKDVIACLRRHHVYDDSTSDEQILEDKRTAFNWVPRDPADPNYNANADKWTIECTRNPREFQ